MKDNQDRALIPQETLIDDLSSKDCFTSSILLLILTVCNSESF